MIFNSLYYFLCKFDTRRVTCRLTAFVKHHSNLNALRVVCIKHCKVSLGSSFYCCLYNIYALSLCLFKG